MVYKKNKEEGSWYVTISKIKEWRMILLKVTVLCMAELPVASFGFVTVLVILFIRTLIEAKKWSEVR